MTEAHAWVVDYEPVSDAPVEEGSGASTPRFTSTGDWDDTVDVPEGENRNGLAVLITDGVKRIEVGRIAFKAELKRRSQFERKLRDIEDTIAQPACDARNKAEANLARVRRDAAQAVQRARDVHAKNVSEARDALRRIELEPIKAWDGEAAIDADAPDED